MICESGQSGFVRQDIGDQPMPPMASVNDMGPSALCLQANVEICGDAHEPAINWSI